MVENNLKKLLFINGHLNPGGVERALADILRNLDYSKYEVDIVLLEELGAYRSELPEQVNVRLIDLHNTYGSLPKALLRCVLKRDWLCLKMRLLFLLCKHIDNRLLKYAKSWLFKDMHYDVAVGFRPGICTDLVAFAAESDKKLTWWHHGEYSLSEAEDRSYKQSCAQMNHVVAVSNGCAQFLKEQMPENADKITVIPNIVPVEEIKCKAEMFAYPVDRSKTQIVSVGRLSPEKHMENCIYVASQLLLNGVKDFQWTFVGDGPEQQHLKDIVNENNLQNYVVFVGNQSNPYPYIKNAELLVHPSYVESQGLVILEAMALGVPCVVTKSIGPCEFIEDGKNGVLAEPSAVALTEKVLEMLRDQALYERIKQNTNVPEYFLTKAVISVIESVLEA